MISKLETVDNYKYLSRYFRVYELGVTVHLLILVAVSVRGQVIHLHSFFHNINSLDLISCLCLLLRLAGGPWLRLSKFNSIWGKISLRLEIFLILTSPGLNSKPSPLGLPRGQLQFVMHSSFQRALQKVPMVLREIENE